jgi:hypothetical protein
MTYRYSICHPEKEKIEYIDSPISGSEVLSIAKNYPWVKQLQLSDSLDQSKVYYSPSLDFTSINNGQSFCLTADYDKNKQLQFSLWYNRPKKVKVLFGLLGTTEKMVVDDVWGYSFEDAIKYLEHFVDRNYRLVEALYRK